MDRREAAGIVEGGCHRYGEPDVRVGGHRCSRAKRSGNYCGCQPTEPDTGKGTPSHETLLHPSATFEINLVSGRFRGASRGCESVANCGKEQRCKTGACWQSNPQLMLSR